MNNTHNTETVVLAGYWWRKHTVLAAKIPFPVKNWRGWKFVDRKHLSHQITMLRRNKGGSVKVKKSKWYEEEVETVFMHVAGILALELCLFNGR